MVSQLFTIVRGDTTEIQVTYRNKNTKVGIDITGYTVFFTVKSIVDDDETDGDAIIKVETTSLTNPTQGITVIELSSTNTDVAPGIYVADVQFKDPSGKIISSESFDCEITGDITRRTS